MPVVPAVFNLGEFLLDRHLAEGRGEKVAIFYQDKKYRYREVVEAANRIGTRNQVQALDLIENSDERRKYDLTSLRICMSSGEALPRPCEDIPVCARGGPHRRFHRWGIRPLPRRALSALLLFPR